MTPGASLAGLLLWSIALAGTAFMSGQRVQANADKAAQIEATEIDAENLRFKSRAALNAGLRTEQAQAKTDTIFQHIRTDYETQQRHDPAIGCVLDPVSLRLWNAANTQSDGAAASEPAGEMPEQPADPAMARERGQ